MFELFKNIFAFIGAIVIILTFLQLLSWFIPVVNKIRSKFWNYFAQKYELKALEKKAIASKIENIVNDTVSVLQKELPIGWIKKAEIKWIDKENPADLKDGEMILRIRPFKDQDLNLLNGVYFFFSKLYTLTLRRK